MWEYIAEEPDRLKDLLESNQLKILMGKHDFSKLRRIFFVGSGTSYNIAMIVKWYYEKLSNIEVFCYTPGEFLEGMQKKGNDGCLVIAVSQTGTSFSTIKAVKEAKRLGHKVLTITERKDTPIAKLGDYYLNFLCGLENCNAKTKGFSNSLTLLQLFALELGRLKGVLEECRYMDFMKEIKVSIDDLPSTIQNTKAWIEKNPDWSTVNHFLVIASDADYGVAQEGMLKVLETLCVPASICELGEFSHGFHRTIRNNSNVITIKTEASIYDNMDRTNQYLQKKTGRLLVLNASGKRDETDSYINLPKHTLTRSMLNISVAFQVLATALPEVIGLDPNFPMNEDYTKLVGTRI
jgi:glucosamine 6-phosphate synthetase-like amidotransferase/phosphosugar isomerase protein